MNKAGAAVFSAFVIIAATAAHGQERNAEMAATSRVDDTQSDLTIVAPQSQQQSRPLFTRGGVEFHVWAPVRLPYDPHADRNFAADPFGDG